MATPSYRVAEAAELLGVSDDTVRRWVGSGRVPGTRDGTGVLEIPGDALARLAQELATDGETERPTRTSARNRLPGLVTSVRRDGLVAQVDIQAGPFRVVSLMTREAADDLGLEAGSRAVASIKATAVVVERA